MENMKQSSKEKAQALIIDLAISIYHNLGIKKWIEEISMFQHVQTYFEICQIIFPEYNINFYRIDQDENLTQAKKIQALINLLSNILKIDLSHISGEEIRKGKRGHLIDILQLFQALSNNMIKEREGSVHSACQHRSSKQLQNSSYYTVMGIQKEFKKYINRSQQKQQTVNKSNQSQEIDLQDPKQRSAHNEVQPQSQSSNSHDDFPIKPKTKYSTPKVKEEIKNQQQNRPSSINNKHNSTINNKKSSNYPISKLHQKIERENTTVVKVIKNLIKTQQGLLNKKNIAQQKLFEKQQREKKRVSKQQKLKIQKQAEQRKRFIEQKLINRNEILKSIEGEEVLSKKMKKLFKEQQKAKKMQKQKIWQREQRMSQQIMNFKGFDKLLQEAVSSNSSKGSFQRQK